MSSGSASSSAPTAKASKGASVAAVLLALVCVGLIVVIVRMRNSNGGGGFPAAKTTKSSRKTGYEHPKYQWFLTDNSLISCMSYVNVRRSLWGFTSLLANLLVSLSLSILIDRPQYSCIVTTRVIVMMSNNVSIATSQKIPIIVVREVSAQTNTF